jgi:hypothetical protein
MDAEAAWEAYGWLAGLGRSPKAGIAAVPSAQ